MSDTWEELPTIAEEASLDEVADWGPTEDWGDWVPTQSGEPATDH